MCTRSVLKYMLQPEKQELSWMWVLFPTLLLQMTFQVVSAFCAILACVAGLIVLGVLQCHCTLAFVILLTAEASRWDSQLSLHQTPASSAEQCCKQPCSVGSGHPLYESLSIPLDFSMPCLRSLKHMTTLIFSLRFIEDAENARHWSVATCLCSWLCCEEQAQSIPHPSSAILQESQGSSCVSGM